MRFLHITDYEHGERFLKTGITREEGDIRGAYAVEPAKGNPPDHIMIVRVPAVWKRGTVLMLCNYIGLNQWIIRRPNQFFTIIEIEREGIHYPLKPDGGREFPQQWTFQLNQKLIRASYLTRYATLPADGKAAIDFQRRVHRELKEDFGDCLILSDNPDETMLLVTYIEVTPDHKSPDMPYKEYQDLVVRQIVEGINR